MKAAFRVIQAAFFFGVIASSSHSGLNCCMEKIGTVYLVGAGPGDAGLFTLRGAELLKRAEVVVYDALVNQDLLRLAPKSAELIYGGKRSKDHAIPQEELNQLLVKKAREGKIVVRLKGGDPYIFGRGGEEAEELAQAGIPFEVVPGVSSITAATNYAGIPITHRDFCSSFTVLTGHEDPTKGSSNLDWAHLAKDRGTKIILMAVERIEQIAEKLIEHGMPPETPVGMVRWGTTGKQQSIQGTLESIGARVKETGFGSPAITVVGEVVKLRKNLNWFEKRPLFGQRVVVTRTREQSSELTARLNELGADVLEIPTIQITAPDRKEDLKDALLGLHEYNWIVFTSPNGVTTFFDYFFKVFDDLRDLGGVRIAAVGPATAAKLKELHLKVDVMPEEYVAGKVAEAMAAEESVENLRVLLMRAEVANRDLPRKLEEMGAIVDDVASYKTVPSTDDLNGAVARLMDTGAEWITFTSSSTVENFNARIPLAGLLKKFPELKTVSIGPETSKALKALGLEPSVEARTHTIAGMIDSVLKQSRKRP
ncbi:MAG: uroporphyrinogen-III C-methyltransferase [Verrucomicrobiota bacterium]|nr:uroporphyrinogen-III C-methyltransferase [Verrucomicrobiota bacterium]